MNDKPENWKSCDHRITTFTVVDGVLILMLFTIIKDHGNTLFTPTVEGFFLRGITGALIFAISLLTYVLVSLFKGDELK